MGALELGFGRMRRAGQKQSAPVGSGGRPLLALVPEELALRLGVDAVDVEHADASTAEKSLPSADLLVECIQDGERLDHRQGCASRRNRSVQVTDAWPALR